MKPIAIVTPWYGAELTGGAEQQARQVATRLAAHNHEVVVLTTCNRTFHDEWSVNYYEPGESLDDGVRIKRFSVDARDGAALDRVNAKLLAFERSKLRAGVSPVTGGEALTFIHENIKSAALLDHLRVERDRYHAFIFLPYMFATSVLGVPIVADRAWLQPCLHDEPAAYLPQVAAMFRAARGLLFNSAGEMELALRLYGPGIYNRSTVVGEGIEPISNETGGETSLPAELTGTRFVLYLGRRDQTKNTDLLVRAFARFKADQPQSDLQLVLAGPGSQAFAAPGVNDLGPVSTETRNALLRNCAALAQPSHHESFSRAIMEAWSQGRPVMAQRDCLATATAVKECGGGFAAGKEDEWAELFARVVSAGEDELNAMGVRGRLYAAEVANWEKVIPRYEMLLELRPPSSSEARRIKKSEQRPNRRRKKTAAAVHQLLPDIAYGDAISNQARAIRDHLRRQGYASDIFVKRREPRMASEALCWDDSQPSAADALLYHHSIGSELTAFAADHAGPKCLVYHNITPANFFESYRPGFAWMLETGRENLPRLARFFPVSVGDSAYNAAELIDCGFRRPGVLPIIIDPQRWNIAPDEAVMDRLQDGKTNLLYVGRMAPNKRQDHLIEMFATYRELDPCSRLILAGEMRASDPFCHRLRATVESLGLSEHVEITGQIDEAALLAYYRTAHLYWSPSAHEGFGAPLVEAMWFDVPVLAMKSSAVPETLGAAGALYETAENLPSVAELAYQLVHDQDRREAVIGAQRKRRVDFTSAAVSSRLSMLIDELITQ
jgi:glycosyltransferase involved in cell wall biosynthesis